LISEITQKIKKNIANHLNDDLLITLINDEGKDAAFAKIVAFYKIPLYWHIRKIIFDHDDTDDVLQNAFIKAWKGLDGFRAESKLFTWLYRIATNEAISFLHAKRKKLLISVEELNNAILSELESDCYFDGDEQQLRLQKAILQLPEKQRIVFTMKYFNDLKFSQMAEILDTSEGALKASYHHAVKKIEEYLTK
jgi:RNA polymerase sigma-70 factor, ECF subfamily